MRRLLLTAGLLLAILAPRAGAQVRLSVSSGGTFIEHRTRLGDSLIEKSAGPSVTARGRATMSSWFEAEAYLSGGSLKAERSTTYDQRLTEAGGRVTVLATPWLALRAGASYRTYVANSALRSYWTSIQLAAEVRQPILGTALHGLVEGTLMPVVWVRGYAHDPNLATGARTGLVWEGRRVTAALRYGLTRYRFPGTGASAHSEQLSTLTVELGLRLNGIPAR